MEKMNFVRRLLEKGVATKAMTRSVMDLEKTDNLLETWYGLLMKAKEEFLSCSLQTITSRGRIMHKLLKQLRSVQPKFAIKVVELILRYCSKEVYKFIQLISS